MRLSAVCCVVEVTHSASRGSAGIEISIDLLLEFFIMAIFCYHAIIIVIVYSVSVSAVSPDFSAGASSFTDAPPCRVKVTLPRESFN